MRENLVGGEAHFEKLIAHSYSGVTLFDSSLQIIYRSPSAERITGWKDLERAEAPVDSIVHPDDLPMVENALQSVLKSDGEPYILTFRVKHYEGHYIWLESTYSNMLSEPGINAIVCNFKDVTAEKKVESALRKQTEQISELLDTMTDGFISLDEHLCYTYANKNVLTMVGMELKSLLGKYIWDVFPDAVGSATYQAIQTAVTEKIYVCNEDFYAPLQLWQENRVYPSAGGVSVFIRDITKQKKEEHHLKLLESVITNTTDSILITEAEPFDEPGPRILYVNEAFTKMTGYTAEEVIGLSPRILQGPKTDKEELARLSRSIRSWQPCEVTLLNYKKSGEEFWINFTLTPVADENGWYTHWISIERDVTKRKNEELRATFLAGISTLFTDKLDLPVLLNKLLERLVNYGHFKLAEIWLIGADKNKMAIAASVAPTDAMQTFYKNTHEIRSFIKKDEGPTEPAGNTNGIQFLDNLDKRKDLLRGDAARDAGLQAAYVIPLTAGNLTIGALVLGLGAGQEADTNLVALFPEFSTRFGAEIKRKQLEQDLNQVFNFAPDILCIIGTDYRFKKVNPAMSALLEYSEEEILAKTLGDFLHPDDLEASRTRLKTFIEHKKTLYFENRFVSKSGRVIWLSWTASNSDEEGLIFAVGKDITDKKELKSLLDKVTALAMVGGWEVDVKKGTVYWSKITKRLHEVEPNYEPTIETGINFYRQGHDRDTIIQLMSDSINKGTSTDVELQIVTAKGNTRWVRVVGEPEFVDGKCVGVYGSFQDIDARVKAETSAKAALEERNVILESIGDAFFAVDKNWVVTYWNNMAEKVLFKPKAEMLNHNLWEVFKEAVGYESYNRYHEAIQTGLAVHFEDYYPPLKKWYEISAYPSVNGLSVYFKDITERKVTESLLKDSEKRYSELFQLSPLPKWVFDLDTLKFLDVNNAAIEHYGYSLEEFLSMTIKEIRPLEDMPALGKILEEHKNEKQFTLPGNIRHKRKNGEIILVDIKSNDISYKGKNARIIVANDITERLSYIQAIEQQNEKLKEISWMQSHIIRAPLARIMGLVPLLNDAINNPEARSEIMEYIKLSANELDSVIGDITDKTNVVPYKG
jgi:PAS domain S-box-containing protein